MTTIDMTQATQGIDMNDPDLVAFSRVDSAFFSLWSWITPDGHDIDLNGSGLTYDANGRALTGTVTSIAIDLGNNNFSDPDVLITKIAVDASPLDNNQTSFWGFLSGDDTFLGPLIENGGTGFSRLFGDAFQAPAQAASGGDDLFRAGDTSIQIAGDVFDVNTGATFSGGNDRIFGAPTERSQGLSGDAFTVQGTGVLIGGDDIMAIRAVSSTAPFAFGDAVTVHGFGGLAKVLGGDDRIIAEDGSSAQLSGDVGTAVRDALITGGNDMIGGSERSEAITGDVFTMVSGSGVEITGGSDILNGKGGNDIISGDVHVSRSGGIITGGNDTINGGEGDDQIFGEIASGDGSSIGGDDDLFGDAGNDSLFGQSGNDVLDGGAGADALRGGDGRDAASYGSATAGVVADLLDASLNTGDAAGDGYNTIENLIGSSFADSLRGDNAANALFGGLGNDVLVGRGGNDRLLGQGGRDRLDGGTGNDELAGGSGIDTFVFRAGYDADRIIDYNDAFDRIDLRSFGFDAFADVAAIATDTAEGLRLDFGGGDQLIIENFARANFDAGDVLI